MDPISVNTPDLIFGTRTISGSLTGSSIENEDNLLERVYDGLHTQFQIRPSDRWFFGGLALMAILMIALAGVWPQGQGARSPAPFGHPVIIPDYVKVDENKARMRKDAIRAAKEAQARASGGIVAGRAEPAEPAR